MDADPNQRPTAKELHNIFNFWRNGMDEYDDFGYTKGEVKAEFEKADKDM